ncbi:MAG: hypothetical protein LBC53_07005 [Spirochaetaceae bacterium]|nr:hypothetical protein [Spirochaetaceae bacterium]
MPFLKDLEEALNSRREYLEKICIQDLKTEMKLFRNGISGLYNLLVVKGHIIDDIYKNDSKTDRIKIPDETPILETKKRNVLGERLARLDNQFDYICNFMPVSVDVLTHDVINQITALVLYVEWANLTPDSESVNTIAMLETIMAMRQGSVDSLSISQLNELLNGLAAGTEKILGMLKEIKDFQNEYYKYQIRLTVSDSLPPEKKTVENIAAVFSKDASGGPFYKDLVEQIIMEDLSPDALNLQGELIARLSKIPEKKTEAEKKAPETKPVLIQGLNIIGSVSTCLPEIMEKVMNNHAVLQSRNRTFFKRLAGIFSGEKNTVVYEFMVLDPVKNTVSPLKLNFSLFCAEVDKKNRIFSAMTAGGIGMKKLRAMPEEQLFALLRRNLQDVFNLYKTLLGLDEFFKNGMKEKDKLKIKGIKPELTALKNIHVQAGKKLAEYEFIKEECEQAAALGVATP